MTIELQTGLPGNGKTLYTLDRLENLRKKTGRPIFYSGIPINQEKLPDWQELPDPKKWFDVPPESIVVIDEAQRIFRPRGSGTAVPEWESRLETHRHGGIDLVLLTQNPKLISTNVRELCGKHYHIVRNFGLQRATVHEWQECHVNTQVRRDSIKHLYKYNKKVYSWYKSAEAHTVKAAVPMKVWLLGAILVGLPIFGYFFWQHLKHMADPKPVNQVAGQQPTNGVLQSQAQQQAQQGQRLSPEAWVASYDPRVRGLHYTAPAYDDVTKPVRAPYPAACVQMKSRCQCYTQQGTRLDVQRDLCESIVAGGFFLAWDEQRQEQRVVPGPVVDRKLTGGFDSQEEAHNLTPGYVRPTRVVASVSQAKQETDMGQGRGKALPKVAQ